jgi:hypothetical protein
MGASRNELENDQDVADELHHFAVQEWYGASFAVPRFLTMKPLGRSAYACDLAWTQESEISTKHILQSVCINFRTILDQALDVALNVAILDLGKRPPTDGSDNSSNGALKERVRRKMNDPAAHPRMDPKEVMVALELSKSAVYEHKGLERVATGTRAVRFSTKSVVALRNSPPE